MGKTDQHEWPTPNDGDSNYEDTFAQFFEQLDDAVEIRGVDSDKTNHSPVAGAKFVATDTEKVYIGDGSSWNHLPSTGKNPSFDSLDTGDLSNESLDGNDPGSNPPLIIKADDISGSSTVAYINDDSGTNAERKAKYWVYNQDGTQRISEITLGEAIADGGEFSVYLTGEPISNGVAPVKVFDISSNGDGTFNAQFPNTKMFHSECAIETLTVGGSADINPHASGSATLSAGESTTLNASDDYSSGGYTVALSGDASAGDGEVEWYLDTVGSQPQFNAVERTGTDSVSFNWSIIKLT